MYATCLFCNRHLGTNSVIEHFPVGRRLAFDAARGRLWVVCGTCERWNLTPFEERWEAVEDCERRFRNARKRVCSANIGLARLDEGLEVVRIGEPLRPELAAWRYGDQFARRHRRAASGWGAYKAVDAIVTSARRRVPIARIPTAGSNTLTVHGENLGGIRLRPDLESVEGWSLELSHESGRTVLAGPQAVNATALLSPKVNRTGAPPRSVQQALRLLEALDDPLRYLLAAAHVADAKAPGHKVLLKLPLEVRLAIEMAANEENERFALEGEMALLELDWKEAEEIAAIADSLLIPPEVEEQLQRMRRDDHPHFFRC
jgi:hypothetical protein